MSLRRLALVALPAASLACLAPTPRELDAPAFDELRPTQRWTEDDVRLPSSGDDAVLGLVSARFGGVAREQLSVVARSTDELGLTHVRVQQRLDGVPVEGGDVIAHLDGDTVYAVGGSLVEGVALDVRPTLLAVDARALLADALAVNPFGFVDAMPGMDELSEPELRVVPASDGLHLAWRSSTLVDDTERPAQVVAVVDAHSGELLELANRLETARPGGGGGGTVTRTAAVGSGSSLYSGTVALNTTALSTGGFELRDIARFTTAGTEDRVNNLNNRTSGAGSLMTDSDNSWGDGTVASAQSAAVDAHYGASQTFDYFKNVHGRNGIANNGSGAVSRVHYGRAYNNAFWSDSCNCMTYGDGDGFNLKPLVSLDVAAHEMTHGVTSRTAGLIYSGESGGINESISDIFGTAVEFAANNASDPGDYLIGEEIAGAGLGTPYLRSMSNPRADGSSIDHYSQYAGGMDVHHSSGLSNIAFALMSEGGTHPFSGQSVAGIGRANAERVVFRALTTYMTSTTTFAGERAATVNAARDLFGASSPEASAVAAVWTACGVN